MNTLVRALMGILRRREASPLPPPRPLPPRQRCPICGGEAPQHDLLDFNRSCEDHKGPVLPRSGRLVAYCLCPSCGFCFAPEFLAWEASDFAKYIYNGDYERVDPDCKGERQKDQIEVLERLLGGGKDRISHVDYGAGLGLLSGQLAERGWQSTAYDPYLNRGRKPAQRFDLVTAFEVFEHVPHPNALMDDIQSLLKQDGLLLFSTILSDGLIRPSSPLDWWYAAPRNGHISLYSAKSLRLLMERHGFQLVSLSSGYHYAFAGKPPC
jgi:SAM-dependent methyltransferase